MILTCCFVTLGLKNLIYFSHKIFIFIVEILQPALAQNLKVKDDGLGFYFSIGEEVTG